MKRAGRSLKGNLNCMLKKSYESVKCRVHRRYQNSDKDFGRYSYTLVSSALVIRHSNSSSFKACFVRMCEFGIVINKKPDFKRHTSLDTLYTECLKKTENLYNQIVLEFALLSIK